MESIFNSFAEGVAAAAEFATLATIALATGETALRSIGLVRQGGDPALKKLIWLRFAGSILLALEFALAADIARTAIAPSWDDIGHLAAIAAIRTLLSAFLGRDMEAAIKHKEADANVR